MVQMPTEYIDTIVESLKHEPASTPCIFNCQMGKGRTTLGMVAACLVKEITITAELRYSLFINDALGHFISIWPLASKQIHIQHFFSASG